MTLATRSIRSALAGLSLLAAACAPQTAEVVPQTAEVVPNAVGAAPFAIPQDASALRALAKDRTVHFSFGQQGVQLEYYAASGEAFLWLQEQTQTIIGKWKIVERTGRSEPLVCFNYPVASLLTDLRVDDEGWNCQRQSDLQEHVIAIVEGDPFELSSGSTPVVIPKGARWSTSRVLAATPRREDIDYVYLYKR